MPLIGPSQSQMFAQNTIDGIPYEVAYNVVEGSPEGNLYYDRGMIPMAIHVGHEDVDNAILVFMGKSTVITNPVVVGGKNYRTIRREIPHKLPNRPWMFCQGISHIKPIGMRGTYDTYPSSADQPITNYAICSGNRLDGTGLPIYQMAELGLQYVFPTFKIKPDSEVINPTFGHGLEGYPDEAHWLSQSVKQTRYITRSIKRQSKILTIPRGVMKGSDGKLILEAIPVTENVATFEYTWHQVPEDGLPEQAWAIGAHSVNQDTFDGRPPGTLLFSGEPEVRSDPNPITGQMYYTVKYSFASLIIYDDDPLVLAPENKIKGHNFIRKVVGGKLKPIEVSTDGTGGDATVMYKDFDFTRFFRPDPVTP